VGELLAGHGAEVLGTFEEGEFLVDGGVSQGLAGQVFVVVEDGCGFALRQLDLLLPQDVQLGLLGTVRGVHHHEGVLGEVCMQREIRYLEMVAGPFRTCRKKEISFSLRGDRLGKNGARDSVTRRWSNG
jgi:hypothetical protein